MTAPQAIHTFDPSLLQALTDSPELARRNHGVRFHHFYGRQLMSASPDVIFETVLAQDEEAMRRKGDLLMTVVTAPMGFVGLDAEDTKNVVISAAIVRPGDQGCRLTGRFNALQSMLRGDHMVMTLSHCRVAITERRLPLLLVTSGNIKPSIPPSMLQRFKPVMLAPATPFLKD